MEFWILIPVVFFGIPILTFGIGWVAGRIGTVKSDNPTPPRAADATGDYIRSRELFTAERNKMLAKMMCENKERLAELAKIERSGKGR